MDWHVHSELSMVVTYIGVNISLLLMAALPPSLSQSPPSIYHFLCSRPYICGALEVYYTFWGGNRPRQCGGDENLQLTCKEDDDGYDRKYAYINMGSQRFSVENEDPLINDYTVKLVPIPRDGEPDVCSLSFDYFLNDTLFTYNQTVHNITIFYDCTYSYTYSDNRSLGCGGSGVDGDVVYYNGTVKEVLTRHPDLQSCNHLIQVPAEAVLKGDGVDDASALHFGEGVLVNSTFSQDCKRCVDSGGSCGSNHTHPFTCYCPDGSNALQCPHVLTVAGNHWKWIVIGTVAAVVVGVLVLAMAMAIYFYQRRKKTTYGMSSDPSSLKDTEKRSQYFGAQLHCSLAVAHSHGTTLVKSQVI